MKFDFVRISVNVTGKPRYSVMEGRDYIVLPVVILMEGVHAGSNGPVLYELADMEKFAPSWNHKPVVVYHPKKNGEYVSADDPAILSANKVGILMANKINGKSQEAEAWLEKSRLKEVDSRILDAIDKGLVVEVSTGLFNDTEEIEGEWEGEPYTGIARNYRPDHLALLPDLIGACSVEDGCGMFTASEAMTIEKAQEVQLALNSVFPKNKENKIKDTPQITNWKKSNPDKKIEDKPKVNEMSFGDISSSLYDKVQEKTQPSLPQYGYVKDVYPDYFIYCVGDDYYKQGYKQDSDGDVELVGDAIQVQKEVSYIPVTNEDKTMPTKNCECKKEIKTLVDSLISANKDWKEEDREYLQKQEEKMLNKFVAMQTQSPPEADPTDEIIENEEEVVENEEEVMDNAACTTCSGTGKTGKSMTCSACGGSGKASTKNTTANTEIEVVVPKPNKKITVDEYIKQAPGPIRELLNQGLESYKAQRKRLSDIIISNDANKFTQADLNGFDNGMLGKLAALAVEDQEEVTTNDLLNFVGNAGAPVQTDNSVNQEALPLPVMNFKRDK